MIFGVKHDQLVFLSWLFDSSYFADDEISQGVGEQAVNEYSYCIKNCKSQQTSDYEDQNQTNFV